MKFQYIIKEKVMRREKKISIFDRFIAIYVLLKYKFNS